MMHPKASHAYRPPRLLLAFGLLEFILPACLAALLIIGGTCVAQPRMRTAAADSNATRALANFFPIEQNSTDVFRWSRWEATLRLWGFEQSAPIVVRMRLSAQREPGQPPAMLTVAGAGAAVPITSPGWRRYMFALPPPARGDQAPAVVLHSSPAQFASDPRELGVALAWVEASQYPGSVLQRLPDPRRVAFLTLLVLLLGGAARSAGASKRAAQSAMLGAALLLAIGIAAAPEALAYWLPNLWLALLTGWLALALPPVLRALRAQVAARPSAAAGCGLLAVAAAQALLPLGQRWSSGLGWALLVGGGLLLVAGLPRALPRAETTLPQRAVALALGATTLLALALRLAALDSLPLGMWRDEARHGLLALRILNDPSYRPVYVPVIADIPALLFYLDTVPIAMFGPHAWAVRLVPALAGALTPLALYFVARPWFGARVALLASFLLAVSVWHVGISRLGFAATLGPPLTLLAIGLFWRGLAPGPAARRFAQAALAGGCAGLAVYAYHPSRLTPLVAALTVAALLGRDWRAWRAALPRLALAATIGLLVLLPLIRYAVGNQAGYSRRVGQTFLLTSDESAGQAPAWLVEQNGRQIAGMWNERGDTNARHNLANTPMLDPISGALFVLGVALALVNLRDRRVRALLAWLAVMLIPGILSGTPPHAVRTVEAIAPSIALAALGADALLRWLEAGQWRRASARAGWGAAGALLALVLALNGWRYFVEWPASAGAYSEFYTADTAIGTVARQLASAPEAASGYRIFIPRQSGDSDVLDFLTAGLAVNKFDARRPRAPEGERWLLLMYGEQSASVENRVRAAFGADTQLLGAGPPSPITGKPAFVIYGRGPEAQALVARVLAAQHSWLGSARQRLTAQPPAAPARSAAARARPAAAAFGRAR